MEQHSSSSKPDPSKIMQIGMGFWASKVMLAAVKFNLFSLLAGKSISGKDIKEKLGLKTTQRHVYDFLDALVSLGFLQREGVWDTATYSNSPETDLFLDRNKPSYIGGILEMANNRLYQFWGNLEEGLITGLPQNESRGDGDMHFFEELYQSEEKLHEFMNAMSGIQMGNFMSLVKQFNFSDYQTFADIGGADGWLSVQVGLNHPRIHCITYDLPPVEPLAIAKIKQFNLQERVKFTGGDFLKDPIPPAQVIAVGNILHGLHEESKLMLLQKIFDTLPEGGVLIAIENIIDNDRKQNTFGLLMSLNMLIENGDAFDYTFADFETWAKKTGFKKTMLMPLAGPTSAAIAYK